MMRKFTVKAVSLFMTILLAAAMFSSTARAAKPGGGGGGSTNTAPVISLGSIVPSQLVEDTTTSAVITLSAVDKENNRFTWSIFSVSFGTASLSGTINPTGTGTIKVNYTAQTNQNGTAVITVQAKDKSGAAGTCPISIVVHPINDMPVCQTLPSISGTVGAGQTVTANNGTWSDVETPAASLAYSYQWQLADTSSGTNTTNAAAAKSYTITSSNSGKYIRVGVTATDTGDNGAASLSTTAYSSWSLIGQQQAQEAQYYVALGDSIAAGTNNENIFGNSYRYTNTFSSSLAAIFSGTSYSYKNDANPGDTTDDLLSKLQTNSTIRSDVGRATIITISIGGNNVLDSASPEGYSKINDAAAAAGVSDFAADIKSIVNAINSLHVQGHLPQIYIMDLYNLYHPWERGWVINSNGSTMPGFMHNIIYTKYISKMQAAIDAVALPGTKVYHVNTYDAFENYSNRFAITNLSHLKYDPAFISGDNPNGAYFYSPYIEKIPVYCDTLTRFDIYPFIPILFDYANVDKYRDPHPDQEGHNVLSTAHLEKFKQANGLN